MAMFCIVKSNLKLKLVGAHMYKKSRILVDIKGGKKGEKRNHKKVNGECMLLVNFLGYKRRHMLTFLFIDSF